MGRANKKKQTKKTIIPLKGLSSFTFYFILNFDLVRGKQKKKVRALSVFFVVVHFDFLFTFMLFSFFRKSWVMSAYGVKFERLEIHQNVILTPLSPTHQFHPQQQNENKNRTNKKQQILPKGGKIKCFLANSHT